jgi:threonine synthase
VTYNHAAARAGFLAGLGEGARPDIFRYAAMLPVHDLALAPPLRVGQTPLYRADRLAAVAGLQNVWVKDDGLNPSASFKDRAGAVALVVARQRKATVIAGATTGNAGSSMACLSASVGQPCVIFLPEKAPPAKIAQLLVFGAKVIAVRGTYDQAFDLCVEVCQARGWFNRNTGANPFTREGKKTCSFEIWEQLGRQVPDWVAVSTGDGNILSGIWKGWSDLKAMGLIERTPRLLCAQAHTSNAVSRAVWNVQRAGRPARWSDLRIEPVQATTLADSISVDLPRDGLAAVRAVIESRGIAVTVPDEDILAAIPELARNSGVFAEPAASCAWACVRKAAREGQIKREETVVCVSTGNGLKDVGTARKSVGEPCVVDATLSAVQRAIGEGS